MNEDELKQLIFETIEAWEDEEQVQINSLNQLSRRIAKRIIERQLQLLGKAEVKR